MDFNFDQNLAKGKIKIVYSGDSPLVNTGFGTAARGILSRLAKIKNKDGSLKYYIVAVGINDRGSATPDRYTENMQCVPLPYLDRDPYGYETLPQVLHEYHPDVVFALNDIWLFTGAPEHNNVDWFLNMCRQHCPQAPIIAYFPVDGEPYHPHWIEFCRQVNMPVVYSDYAVRVVREAGYEGDLRTIYHGSDLSKFFPLNPQQKEAQRKEFRIPEGNKLVGIVARNMPRKNIPVAIRIIKMVKDGYVRCSNCNNIYSPDFKRCPTCTSDGRVAGDTFEGLKKISTMLHMNLDDRRGHKLRKVIPDERLTDIVFNSNHNIAFGVPVEKLNMIYNSFDVMFFPTMAEGFGLPVLEALATGTLVVATDCTSISEMLAENRGFLVPPSDYMIMDDASNTRKFLIDVEKAVKTLTKALTLSKDEKEDMILNAFVYASQKDWDVPAKQFDELIEELLNKRVSIVDSYRSGDDRQKFFFVREVGDGGDIMQTLPAIKGVREAFPKSEIVYAVPDEYVELLDGVPTINKAVGVKNLWDGTRGTRKNVQIGRFNLYGPEVKYEEATIPLVDKSRIEIFINSCGFKPSSVSIDYVIKQEEREFAKSILNECPDDNKKVFLKVDAPEEYKSWPEEYWKKLVISLSKFKDLTIFVMLEKNSVDSWSNDEKLKDLDPTKVLFFDENNIGIRKSIGILSYMDLIVSSDGPYLHYAGMLKRSMLCLSGPIDYRSRLKHYSGVNVIAHKDKFNRCMPCWRNAGQPCQVNNSLEHSACMHDILVGEVFGKIGMLLNPILGRAANKKRARQFAGVK